MKSHVGKTRYERILTLCQKFRNHDQILIQTFEKYGVKLGLRNVLYTLFDPRAAILKEHAGKLAVKKNMADKFALFDW